MCKSVRKEVEVLMEFAEGDKMVTKSIDNAAKAVVSYFMTKGISLSVAESCTGGMISEAITSVSGASSVYLGGVCSYTEEIKSKVLGVEKETLEKYTVYSSQVACEMSEGVMKLFGSQAAIGVTGLAGPDGGTDEKPIGTVYVSVRFKDACYVKDLMLFKEYEKLDRRKVRMLATAKALEMLKILVENCESED